MLAAALLFGLLGAIVGSFLNVLILRRGVKTLGGRSGCLSCGHELEAIDLVPIISYLALAGRCRFCGSRISIQYPLVEAAAAILFGLLGAAMAGPFVSRFLTPAGLLLAIDYFAIVALLITVCVYDLKHTIIPDSWVYAFAALALLSQFLAPSSLSLVANILAGPLCALPFAALWFVSGGRWMGLGDAKLALGVGWLLGPVYGFLAVMFSFILGAVISVCILLPLSSKRFWDFLRRFTHTTSSAGSRWGFTMKSEVAFGPFLAAACVIIWMLLLFGHDPLAYLPPSFL